MKKEVKPTSVFRENVTDGLFNDRDDAYHDAIYALADDLFSFLKEDDKEYLMNGADLVENSGDIILKCKKIITALENPFSVVDEYVLKTKK